MINISIDGSAIKIVFEDSSRYLYGDGVITAPINSLSLILDNSDLITLTKSSNNDPFVSFLVAESNFASKEEFATWFKSNAVSATGGGSGSGVTPTEVQSMIDDSLEDYYDKDEVDAGFASIQDEIDEKEEVISTSLNDLNDRMDDKQDALEAGNGIDITNNVISVTASTGGSNVIELTQAQYNALVDKDPDVIYVITDAPEINLSGYAQSSAVTAVNDTLTAHTANTTAHTTSAEKTVWNGKQDALVSGTNIKTINNQSILGSGNIDIQGGGTDTGTVQTMIEDYCDPKEEVIATSLVDLNGRVEHLETGGTGVTIATAITSSSTNSEAAGALATYNAITAATTGGGTSYSAGYGITIDTANTISFNMPITCTTNTNSNITIGNGTNNGNWSLLIGNDSAIRSGAANIDISTNDMSIGNGEISGSNAVAIGTRNFVYGGGIGVGSAGIALGGWNTSRDGGIVLGTNSQASGASFVAIGCVATATGTTKMNLNNQIKVDTNNQVYIKDKTNTTDVCIQDAIAALGGLKFVQCTQADYDALVQGGTVDANTLYIITNVVS